MKITASIPGPVFRNAERLAKKMKVSRSRLYAVAVADFAKRYRAAEISEQLNSVYPDGGSSLDKTLAAIQTHALPRERG